MFQHFVSAHPLKVPQMLVPITHVTPTPTQVFMDPIDFQPFDLLSLDIEVQVACFLSTQLWRTEKQQNRDKNIFTAVYQHQTKWSIYHWGQGFISWRWNLNIYLVITQKRSNMR